MVRRAQWNSSGAQTAFMAFVSSFRCRECLTVLVLKARPQQLNYQGEGRADRLMTISTGCRPTDEPAGLPRVDILLKLNNDDHSRQSTLRIYTDTAFRNHMIWNNIVAAIQYHTAFQSDFNATRSWCQRDNVRVTTQESFESTKNRSQKVIMILPLINYRNVHRFRWTIEFWCAHRSDNRDFPKHNDVSEKYSLHIKTQVFRSAKLFRNNRLVVQQLKRFESNNHFGKGEFLHKNHPFSECYFCRENCLREKLFLSQFLTKQGLVTKQLLFRNNRLVM
jgi:hypothetical protein